jgi:hypothetical protein
MSKINAKEHVSFDDWLMSSQFVPVISSNASAIAYYVQTGVLYIRFKNGSTYYYDGVTVELAREVFHCDSIGKFEWKLRRMGLKGKKLARLPE